MPLVSDSWVSFEGTPPNAAAVRERIADTTERFPWLVCDDGGTVLGVRPPPLRPGAYRRSVDSSVYVAEGARRGGVATALYESLFALLRLQGFRNVYAGTALPDPTSAGFHDATGFDPVGTGEHVGDEHGGWRDVRWWHRSLGEYPDDPADPADRPSCGERQSGGRRRGRARRR